MDLGINIADMHIIFVEKNNMDLGINIADDLEQLKNNLNKFKNSKENICCLTSEESNPKFTTVYTTKLVHLHYSLPVVHTV